MEERAGSRSSSTLAVLTEPPVYFFPAASRGSRAPNEANAAPALPGRGLKNSLVRLIYYEQVQGFRLVSQIVTLRLP